MTEIKTQTQTIIRKYGYEYILVEVDRGSKKGIFGRYDLPQPCFMGYPNMALKSCRRIGEELVKKKEKKTTYTRKRKMKI